MRPVGAGPFDRLGSRFDGRNQDNFQQVYVNDAQYVAGVSPDRAEMLERSRHKDYSKTDSCMALFYAGLLLTGMKKSIFW